MTHVNVAAILAGLMAGSAGRTPVVEHNQSSNNRCLRHAWAVRLTERLVLHHYGLSGAIVAVALGIADDLAVNADYGECAASPRDTEFNSWQGGVVRLVENWRIGVST